ncbi:NlpC/P60 family protein [Streptomyces sp. WMMC897]|uniref:NlpC/P60 family protein n=1 Tax=Streptomyces sp. WMMC897 TaxID=3014782 RepID=UPI0022B5E669|nr:NlpC/P60 family protein [Streptomyces sp. WMMC897]MCZ7416565.1 NlpC/P60 family protein [Streptomyces sp. WMMC897]
MSANRRAARRAGTRRAGTRRAGGLGAATAVVLALTAPLGPAAFPAVAGLLPAPPGGSAAGTSEEAPAPAWRGWLTGPPRHPDAPRLPHPGSPQEPGPEEPGPHEAPADTPEAPTPGAAESAGGAAGRSVGELLGRLRTLYRAAGSATEQYNAAEEALREQREKVERLRKRLTGARADLDAQRRAAGRLAREQYRGGSAALDPYLGMLLSRTPQDAFHRGHVLDEAAQSQAATVRRLAAGERRLRRTAERARRALERRERLAADEAERRDAVLVRLDDISRLLASLSDSQLAAVRERERTEVRRAQRELLDDGKLGSETEAAARAPSAAGAAAVRNALAQVGKPYRWGAEGPASFDCSGLTSWAWAGAARPIPRTSQEQWRRLPRVGLDQLRPGDLVVYFAEATHVALYIGDGRVVQAPRPGATVKVSPVAANPLLGAVRPDPEGRPLPRYAPPPLPPGASEGTDTGHGSARAPSSSPAPPPGAATTPRPGATSRPPSGATSTPRPGTSAVPRPGAAVSR